MLKIIFPTILLLVSILTFFGYTSPAYTATSALRAQQAAYDEALANSKALLARKNELSNKSSSISQEDNDNLLKVMPDTVDSVRFIINLQKIASQYSMLPRDIKFSPILPQAVTSTPSGTQQNVNNYVPFDLDFTVTGSYENFLAFIKDMEKSMSIMDIVSISFSAPSVANTTSGVKNVKNLYTDASNIFKYTFRIRTYWFRK